MWVLVIFAGKFLGIENLQYTAGFLGLPTEATIREFMAAGQSSCAMRWPDILRKFPDLEVEHLLRYCFGCDAPSRCPSCWKLCTQL